MNKPRGAHPVSRPALYRIQPLTKELHHAHQNFHPLAALLTSATTFAADAVPAPQGPKYFCAERAEILRASSAAGQELLQSLQVRTAHGEQMTVPVILQTSADQRRSGDHIWLARTDLGVQVHQDHQITDLLKRSGKFDVIPEWLCGHQATVVDGAPALLTVPGVQSLTLQTASGERLDLIAVPGDRKLGDTVYVLATATGVQVISEGVSP